MENQPQNPEFRNNLENFHSCDNLLCKTTFVLKKALANEYHVSIRLNVFFVVFFI